MLRKIVLFAAPRLIAWAEARDPDVLIGGAEDPYMRRWWRIPRNAFANAYVHNIRKSDDDRALHDHPWISCSIVLSGAMVEHTIDAGGIHQKRVLRAGAVKFRGAKSAHRLEIIDHPCWTLFLTGPRIRAWGFHCQNTGWIHWKDFTENVGNVSIVGRGCGES
jgi:hypothetical protein